MSANNLTIQNAATPLQPVKPSERIPALDVLRGFALFGVLLAFGVWAFQVPASVLWLMSERLQPAPNVRMVMFIRRSAHGLFQLALA